MRLGRDTKWTGTKEVELLSKRISNDSISSLIPMLLCRAINTRLDSHSLEVVLALTIFQESNEIRYDIQKLSDPLLKEWLNKVCRQ